MKPKKLDDLIASLDFIDVDIDATHLNYINANNVLYTLDAVDKGAKSWIKPYNKPQLLHHDKSKDAVGRIINYEIKDTPSLENEPKDFIRLKVRISDKDAIGKVLKGIYFTCSVGSSTTQVRCSICNQNLIEDGLCEHEKGTIVDGKRVYWIIDDISYKENSFVNNPADSFSRIVSIDIGDGPMEYDKFLNDKEQIINNFFMEDDMKNNVTDGKLSSEQRKKLPDSVFCGPGRSFPAQDKAHVTAGLRLLSKSNFSDSTKQKIKSCLYRKGKRFGIEPQDAEYLENSELILFRINDDFTEEEINIVEDFFKENPDADLPTAEELQDSESEVENTEDNTQEVEYTIDDFTDIKKGKKDEIIKFTDFVISQYKEIQDEINNLKEKVSSLNDEMSEQNTILNSKEDEISKLLDNNAQLSVNYKKSLINNILDFKHVVEHRDEEFKKYDSRKIDSLLDTLIDYRSEHENNIPKIEDETLTDSQESDENTSELEALNINDENVSKIDRFFKNNIITED